MSLTNADLDLTATVRNKHSSFRLWMKRTAYVLGLLLLVIGLVTTSYVTYRHFLVLRTLPKIRLSPQRLTVPISLDELASRGLRWVEVEARASSASGSAAGNYRDTAESPGRLVLQFKHNPPKNNAGAVTTSRRYRGILYTAVNRSRSGVTQDPLVRKLTESGITPGARFAVLGVDESPWVIWKAVIKEAGVVVSGFLILIFFLIQSKQVVSGLFRGRLSVAQPSKSPATWTQKKGPTLAIATVLLAIGWAFYLSVRTRPVLPIETILGFGASAGLSVLMASQRHLMKRKSKSLGKC